MTTLLDDTGCAVQLGSKLGAGGEGSVYNVSFDGSGSKKPDMAAKIYHSAISPDKLAKLECMVGGQSDQLLKLTAWPISTVSDKKRTVCGFLMNKAVDAVPVHHFYSPVQRKQEHSEVNWDFLVNVARNTAAAFHSIHGHGHVIGDVNPNLVFVSRDSRVRLIDCDSFQIFGDGRYFLCEVGVPHFTPPELQKNSSFSDIVRHQNHDNFGLAVLIFHLLLMGRHPFAGVYSGSGDLVLEKSILQFRYAYGRNAKQKQITPPPDSIGPSILPDSIKSYFEKAFSKAGATPEGRPTAQNWVTELDILQKQLQTCDKNPRHKFFSSLSRCPWCAQEQELNISFFKTKVPPDEALSLNLRQLWAKIEAVPPPKPVNSFQCQPFTVYPKELPPDVKIQKRIELLKKMLAALIAFGSLLSMNALFILIALITSAGLWAYNMNTNRELRKRQIRLNSAKKHLSQLNTQWKMEVGDGLFMEKIKELEITKLELKNIPIQYIREKDQLIQNPGYIDSQELNRLKATYSNKITRLEKRLVDGPDHLINIIKTSREKRQELSNLLQDATQKVAQAEADMTVL